MSNTTSQEIFYLLFNQPPQSVRLIRGLLSHRSDFRESFDRMVESGEVVIEGKGTRGSPRTVRLVEGERTATCPHCKGTGMTRQPKTDAIV